MTASIEDVARRARVSIATVSRFAARAAGCGAPSTRDRVLAAARRTQLCGITVRGAAGQRPDRDRRRRGAVRESLVLRGVLGAIEARCCLDAASTCCCTTSATPPAGNGSSTRCRSVSGSTRSWLASLRPQRRRVRRGAGRPACRSAYSASRTPRLPRSTASTMPTGAAQAVEAPHRPRATGASG